MTQSDRTTLDVSLGQKTPGVWELYGCKKLPPNVVRACSNLPISAHKPESQAGGRGCPVRCPVTDYSGHFALRFVSWYNCKSLRFHQGAPGQRIAKPLYGQKLYPGFESLPLRQLPLWIVRTVVRGTKGDAIASYLASQVAGSVVFWLGIWRRGFVRPRPRPYQTKAIQPSSEAFPFTH